MRDSDRRCRGLVSRALSSEFFAHSDQLSKGSLQLAGKHLQRPAANVTGRHGARHPSSPPLHYYSWSDFPIPGRFAWLEAAFPPAVPDWIAAEGKPGPVSIFVFDNSRTGNREVQVKSVLNMVQDASAALPQNCQTTSG